MGSQSLHLWLPTPCLTQNVILSPTLKVHESLPKKMAKWDKKPKNRRNTSKNKVTTIFFLIPHAIKYYSELLLEFGAFNLLKTSRKQRSCISLFLSMCFFPFYNLPPPPRIPLMLPRAEQNRSRLYSAAILASPLPQDIVFLRQVARDSNA